MVSCYNLRILVTVIPLALACEKESNPPPEPNLGPLDGTVNGATFAVVGATATERSGALYVSLSSRPSDCALGVSPAAGTLVVDVQIPDSAQRVGAYELGSAGKPSVTVTTFSSGDTGAIEQQSRTIRQGYLHVLEIDAESVSGSLELSEANTSLNGKFEAPRCPPP